MKTSLRSMRQALLVLIFAFLRNGSLSAEEPPPSGTVQGPGPDVPAKAPVPRPVNIVQDLAEAAPVVPAAAESPIDLSAALQLAESINPTIGESRQYIQEALANRLRARSLLLPSLRAGTNYHVHQGVLQNSFGLMRRVDEESLYVGGGARTLAAETLAFPMVQILSPLTDAFFEPLSAQQLVAARTAETRAVQNTILLEVAASFLRLAGAEAILASTKLSEDEMNAIVQRTANFARTGQGRDGDFRRARARALLLHLNEQQAEAEVAIAAADLSRLLHMDPSVRLRTPTGAIGIIELVDPKLTLPQLIEMALVGRPELAAWRAEIARKQVQARQETFRPLLPTLAVGFSSGAFGGGTNRTDLVPVNAGFGRFGPRADFDVLVYWTALNMGAGNASLRNRRLAERNIAIGEQSRMAAQVAREVTDAYALAEARRQEVEINERRLRTALDGYREDAIRTFGGVGLPIEVLNSMVLLYQARVNLIRATVEYDIAQFQLFVSLGQPPPIR